MTTAQEWEQEFDLLYNNINSNLAPALDTYEKSVFLTMAQEQVVQTLYSGGALGSDGFESTEQMRRYLNILVAKKSVSVNFETKNGTFVYTKGSFGGYVYTLPTDLMYIIQEVLATTATYNDIKATKLVVPTTHDDIYKVMQNPFKAPNDKRAIRVDIGNNNVEIIGGTEHNIYLLSYLRKPYPIILTELSNEQINGKTTPHANICELDESLHRIILAKAVELATMAQNT